MDTFGWMIQFEPIITLLPIKQLGWIIVPTPTLDVEEIATFEGWNGLKYLVSVLKSLNGSSEISKALPIGHSTSLLIKIIVAADCRALS